MTIFNLKNTIIATTLLASSSAMAGYVGFDADGTGSTFNTASLQRLNLESQVNADLIVQDLGVDGIMNSGDTFTENLYYKANSAILGSGFFAPTVALADSNNSNGFYSVSMSLIGHIENYTNTAAAGVTTSASTWGNILTASFDVLFDFKDAAVTLDWNNTDAGTVSTVGVWDVIGGGVDQLSATTGVQNFAIALAFDAGTDDNYFQSTTGGPISDLITINQAFGTGSGSANPVGIAGAGANSVNIAASSNNAAARFDVPEPTSIALLGLGLLGFAGARRRNS